MTLDETRKELDRIVKEEYPLIASEYIDKDIMLRAAKEIEYAVKEWRGVHFPYRRLHEEFMGLISIQYLTTDKWDILNRIGEETVVDFLNRYYRWKLDEREKQSKELKANKFELSEEDKKDYEEFCKKKPAPCKEPLDIAGYLHMCRIAYEAAPMFVFPDFVSDLFVVAKAKFDSCGLARENHSKKMDIGDPYPEFMHYHPEEMGFGGPYVRFEWEDGGWIMYFSGDDRNYNERSNKDIQRFLAMRRAGYPVVFEE